MLHLVPVKVSVCSDWSTRVSSHVSGNMQGLNGRLTETDKKGAHSGMEIWVFIFILPEWAIFSGEVVLVFSYLSSATHTRLFLDTYVIRKFLILWGMHLLESTGTFKLLPTINNNYFIWQLWLDISHWPAYLIKLWHAMNINCSVLNWNMWTMTSGKLE